MPREEEPGAGLGGPTAHGATFSLLIITLTLISIVIRDVLLGDGQAPGTGLKRVGEKECASVPLRNHSTFQPWQFKSDHASHRDAPVEVSIPSWVYQRDSIRDKDSLNSRPGLPSAFQVRGAGGFRSQDGEDEYAMVNFFAGKQHGVILESGALDGVMYSISWAFTEYWGWHAVHVEGFRPNFVALVHNRPDQLNIHAALCNSTKPLHWIQNDDQLTSINGFWEFISQEVKTNWFSNWTDAKVEALLKPTTCRPLSPLLSQFNLHHIDLWVLDIEGSEHMALSTVDWSLTQIDVISVEVLQPQTREELDNEIKVRNILFENNYFEHSTQGRNTWYTRAGFQPKSCQDFPELCRDLPPGVDFRSDSALERATPQLTL